MRKISVAPEVPKISVAPEVPKVGRVLSSWLQGAQNSFSAHVKCREWAFLDTVAEDREMTSKFEQVARQLHE